MTDYISTGHSELDAALGGGIPRGHFTEFRGDSASHQALLALRCIAEAQKAGGVAAFVDAENRLDIADAKRLGVNTDDLLISQPDCGEQAIDIIGALVRSGSVDLIVTNVVCCTRAIAICKMVSPTRQGNTAVIFLAPTPPRQNDRVISHCASVIVAILQMRGLRAEASVIKNMLAPIKRAFVEFDLLPKGETP